jgi:hypothetical protein
MEARWKLFRIVIILQLLLSSLLSGTLIFQSIRNPPKGELTWIVATWLLILIILASLAALHIHLMHKYYPDYVIPGSLITLRLILSILSWISILILSLAIGIILFKNGVWEKFNLTVQLVFSALLILTIASITGLILQAGLIKHIRQNHNKSLLETINQIGQNAGECQSPDSIQ